MRQAVLTGLANVLILGAIYLVTSYALIAITRRGFSRWRGSSRRSVSLLAGRALIALLVTFLFLTQEVWATAGVLDGAPYWLAVLLFPLVAVMFLVARLPRDIGELNRFDAGELASLIDGTPIARRRMSTSKRVEPPPLGRREWGQRRAGRALQPGRADHDRQPLDRVVLRVVGPAPRRRVDDAHVGRRGERGLGDAVARCPELVLTEELLRVAGFLTASPALNFTVYLVTDPTYRAEFREEVVERAAAGVRGAVYLAASEPRVGRTGAWSTMSPT